MREHLTPTKAGLIAAFVTLQVLDVVTTRTVLAQGGFEGNPVGAWVMHVTGDYWSVPKLAVAAACAVVMLRWRTRHIVPWVLLMLLVVVNNAFWAYL